MFTILLSALVIILFFLVYGHKRKFKYWQKKNVPHLKPSLIFGNYKNYALMREIPGVVVQKICEKFPDEPYIGAYYGTDPVLIIQDPELIKLVITKDFFCFNGRELTKYNDKEPITQTIFFACRDNWRILRQNMTPMFTTAKMKNMFHLIEKCTHNLEEMLEEKMSASDTVLINSLMEAFSMDCIGSCSFGIDTNVMKKPDNNPFKTIGSAIFEKSTRRGIINIMRTFWPRIFYFFGLKFFPTELNDFFIKVLTEVFESRHFKPSSRHDFVDIILPLTNKGYMSGNGVPDFKTGEVKKVTMEASNNMLAAQCLALFGAGFETSATTLSFTLYELAKFPEIQEQAIKEVDAYLRKNNNKINYNLTSELPFLEACIDEALRFYPVLGNLTREAMEDYTFPTGLLVEKGTRIHIPVYHLQRHAKYFPDPEVFHPDRFLGDEKLNVNPHVYMPFGGGPKVCLGMRFGKMQMLAGMVTLLKNYRMELDPSTPPEMKFDPRILVLRPQYPIKVKLFRRKIK